MTSTNTIRAITLRANASPAPPTTAVATMMPRASNDLAIPNAASAPAPTVTTMRMIAVMVMDGVE